MDSKHKNFLVFTACFVAYFIVNECFLALPKLYDVVQIRPVSALGPVLGFFFGLPGIFGCASANLLSDVFHESASEFVLLAYFLVQIAYSGLPRWVWYAIYRNSKKPYPRFDSAGKTALYMLLALADSVCVNVVIIYVIGTSSTTDAATLFAARSLNNMCMLLYVGMPLLFVLERSPFAQTPPPWVHVSYKNTPTTNLTQRFVMVFTLCAAVLLLLISVSDFVVEGQNKTVPWIIILLYLNTAMYSLPIFIPMFVLLYFLEKHLIRPTEVLAHNQKTFVERIENAREQGKLDIAVTVDAQDEKPLKEVAQLCESTNKMRKDLLDYVGRMYKMNAEKQRIAAELNIAAQFQLSVLPKDFSSYTERLSLDIAGVMHPAREVGGDFYDVFNAGEQKVAFVIGDAAGKGVGAALFMMRAQSLLRQCILQTSDLSMAFALANNLLYDGNDTCLFITLFACILDTKNGEVRYVNAGHNPPVLEQNGKLVLLEGKHGMVLGAVDGMKYSQETISFNPCDGLLLYTDGVTEATNENGEFYGTKRMIEALDKAVAKNTMQEMVDDLVLNVQNFAAGSPQADDITALGFYWKLPVHKITLQAQTEHLDKLFAFLNPLCQTKGCTQRMMAHLMIICEETFVNICNYGFPKGQPRLPVSIEVSVDVAHGCMHLVFSDYGIAYNPLKYHPKKVDPTDEKRKGGLGILLMREFLDEMRYTRTDGMNILRMTKRFI